MAVPRSLRLADLVKNSCPNSFEQPITLKRTLIKGKKTPFERLTGETPDISHIRTIGSTAYTLEHRKDHRKKFMDKSRKGVLVGFEGSNIYRVWDLQRRVVTRSSHVHIDERLPPKH